ncbi:MAG: transcriptional repressor LexA [Rhodobacteraceae bacterium]|nr:transcriptional repressor LexA [Paracoccaceae bacterium]
MLTKKQLDLLEFIHTRLQADGVPPSFEEMKDALDLRSKSGIHRLITALEERGFIRRLAHKARAIEVVRLPDALEPTGFRPRVIEGDRASPIPLGGAAHEVTTEGAATLPLMGKIAAGVAIEAIQDVERNVTVPAEMLSSSGNHFALEIRGESMIEAGINDGDVVVIKQGNVAENGDIVVAYVDSAQATLKKYMRKGDRIWLEPCNPEFSPIIRAAGQVQVMGKLVGLIRTY